MTKKKEAKHKKLRKRLICMIPYSFFSIWLRLYASIPFNICLLFACTFFSFFCSFVLSYFLSYFGPRIVLAHPRVVSHSCSPSLPLHLSFPLFTQLGLMEQWPNDKDPGEQTHLDSPPAATRDPCTPAMLLLSI